MIKSLSTQALFAVVIVCLLFSCNNRNHSDNHYNALKNELHNYIDNEQARIGVAVIVNHTDTIAIHGNDSFPMMSVFKFPVALAAAKWFDDNNRSFLDTIFIPKNTLHEDTYSPMLKKYGQDDIYITYHELLEWSLIESDNNACDILIARVGGIDSVSSLLNVLNVPSQICIAATEDDMHRDISLSNLNTSTPIAMAALFDTFYSTGRHTSYSYATIADIMEQCHTGNDRLPAPLKNSEAVIGHKTGTGFQTPEGGISALNDCGYIQLPSGLNYSVAVFIADSPHNIAKTSAIIAHISQIIYTHLTSPQPQ